MHMMDSSDAMGIRNKIDRILLDIRAASQTSPGKPYPEFVKELVKKLTEAREILVKRFGISR
jgi:hypothetical protein